MLGDLGVGEDGCVRGEPVGSDECHRSVVEFALRRLAEGLSVEGRRQLTLAKAERPRTVPPLLANERQVDHLLGVARLDRGDLRGPPARAAGLFESVGDLSTARRERVEHGLRDAADLGHALDRVAPFDAE